MGWNDGDRARDVVCEFSGYSRKRLGACRGGKRGHRGETFEKKRDESVMMGGEGA